MWHKIQSIVFLCSLLLSHRAAGLIYYVSSTHASGNGSLAAAITAANASPGMDSIYFALPGTSAASRTIQIDTDSLLPNITDRLVIDGTTQSTGAPFGVSAAKVRIYFLGSAQSASGLAINADYCEIYGLWISHFPVGVKAVNANYLTFGKLNKGNVISHFSTQGLKLTTVKESSVVGCFIGVDTSGLVGTASLAVGIFIETNSKKITIGGKSEAGKNVLSGNYIGLRINSSKFINVQQCYVGTDYTGLISVPNTTGIRVDSESENITIGGDSTKYRNIISGNLESGIDFEGLVSKILGNYIGVNLAGLPLGNGTYGIYLREKANDNEIGDTTLYGGNRIAYNGGEGIYFQNSFVKNIYIRGNRMYCNSQLFGSGGINLNGGNQSLPTPTLAIVTSSFVTGTTYPNIWVDIYAADSCSTCEGSTYLTTVQANSSGTFTAYLDITGKITAITNDMYGNSSAFAACADTGTTSCVYASIFTSSKKTCSFYKVTFNDQSITEPGTTITSWWWEFGDGQTASVANPVITYTTPGVYNVTLKVTNSKGCTDTAAFTLTVQEGVVAVMQVDSHVCLGQPLYFIDLSYAQGSAFITSLQWTLGDGNTSTFSEFFHTYDAVGSYSVKLTVTNNLGCVSTINENIKVHDYPIANFAYSATNCVTTPVPFLDLTQPALGGTIVSWLWNFGDGQTSTLQNPEHLYTASGAYDVSLTVVDKYGCADSETKTVQILSGAIANFSWNINGLTVTFQNNSTFNNDFAMTWYFGDGTSSNLFAPSHTYPSLGIYEVCLIVTDYTCNMSDTLCQYVNITGIDDMNLPHVGVWPNPTNGQLTIVGPTGAFHLYLLNTLGQRIPIGQWIFHKDQTAVLSLPAVETGLYCLEFVGPKVSFTTPIFVDSK